MSPRYPPLSGFNSRDRSPQRFGDRRPPAGPRGSDDVNVPHLSREPPRGPKALIDHPRGAPFGGRGRGYPGRGDFRDRDRDPRDRDRDRDRDFRDIRDGPPPFRRDIDRDWPRRDRDFDPRDSRIGFGRGRSRSPPPPRDFRDMREPLGRDPDIVRMRRGSRDSLLSVSSAGPDGPASGPGPHPHPHPQYPHHPLPHPHPRGGSIRGRGRGDWDGGRGRGRVPYLDDRESFRRRSRSRDGRWDRDRDVRERIMDRDRDREWDRERFMDRDRDLDRRDRERERDLDRRDRFERRDDLDRRPERDDRDRPADLWKRDRTPSRAENRIPINLTAPPVPHTVPGLHAGPATSDRILDHPIVDQARKASIAEGRRDSELLPSRTDTAKDFIPPIKRSPPPAAPQVPAFGSVTAPIPDLSVDKPSVDTVLTDSIPAKTEKERNEALPRAPVQPPTGPKADRGPSQQQLEQRVRRDENRRDEFAETPDKQESAPRAPKPYPTAPVSTPNQAPDLSPPTVSEGMAAKDSAVNHDEEVPTNKPGPVITSPEIGRGHLPSGPPVSPGPHTSPRMQYSSIPTGPRALQQRPSVSRGPSKGNKQWLRPGYSRPPSGPGSTVPPRRESVDGQERSLSFSEELKQEVQAALDDTMADLEAGEIVMEKDTEEAQREEPWISPKFSKEHIARGVSPVRSLVDEVASEEKVVENQDNGLILDFGRSSDEDEDENVVFTQEYLEERKQIFEKDMKALQAEMPLSPLEDPNIVALLMRIQLLGMIANDVAAESASALPPAVEVPKVADEVNVVTPMELKPEMEVEEHELPSKPVVESVSAAAAISVDNLPFLHSGPPTPLSDFEVYHENTANHDRLKEMLTEELMKRQKEIARKNAKLREEYLSHYKPWRLEVWELDHAKETQTPGPATPPAPPIATTPTPVAEGRRYKGNSELDFQMALRASEISAQEELERRRGNKATAQPDLSREAIIPDMLEPAEAKARIYKDTNNAIDPAKAMDVFGFIPPPNDFTPEEHVIFTDAFMAYPKKWWKIAEALPGRNFQQCIVHYYLTKEEIKYKAKLNKRWSRRGRARRSARPKSNALMADLGVVKPDYEGEEEPTPVTDTGRPRRAAAPTFGDSSAADTDQTTNGRRGNAAKDGEPGEKPAGRRGARAGAGTRGGRRGKAAQQQQQQQMPQPTLPEQPVQPIPVPAVAGPAPPVLKAEAPEPSMDGTAEAAIIRSTELPDREPSEAPARAKSGRGRQKEGVYVFESTEQQPPLSTKQPEIGYGSLQPTSYWSVPETRDFPSLLAHFGRDFEGISNFMKTKTTVMVKNYFQRRIDSGQKDFEDIIADAEAKKSRGERTGPLPVPSFASKRRYEATPSTIIMPRPLAPHADAVNEPDESRVAPKNKHVTQSSQPVPLHARPLPEKERNVSRYPPLAQASSGPIPTGPILSEDPSRAIRPQMGLPTRMQGPRLGYFPDERRDNPAAMLSHATPRAQETTISARQTPAPVPEMSRIEPLHTQGFRNSNVDVHGSPLLLAQNAVPSAQQAYMQPQPQPSYMPTHSRQSSLTKPPGSPAQSLHRQEPDISPIRRDSVSQRPFYPLPGQHAGVSQPPILSPSKEHRRSGSTPAEPPAAPRQVPAKRSNIMSILNDEPEEPQPRKRFAGEQTSSTQGTAVSPSRPVYQTVHSLSQVPSARQEETFMSTSQQKGPPAYSQQSQYLSTSRGYSDYQPYPAAPGGSGPPANNDWMARFDPRGQQQPPPQLQQPNNRSTAPQPSFPTYASGQPHPAPSLSNINAPSPVPTPSPAPTPRPSYTSSVYGQPPPSHAQVAAAGSRDLGTQNQMFRSVVDSPTSRNSSIPYGSRQRPPTPTQSPANPLGLGSRAPAVPTSYVSSAQTAPAPTHMSAHPGGHQTYQQHVQTMVNGSHQQQTHRSSLGLTGTPYGHRTPPPQAQSSRGTGLPGPSSQSLAMGRSYTPPAILQPIPTNGMGYAPGGHSPAVGPVHSLQARTSDGPPGGLGHHRVYSQGSNSGSLPSSLNPQHPPR